MTVLLAALLAGGGGLVALGLRPGAVPDAPLPSATFSAAAAAPLAETDRAVLATLAKAPRQYGANRLVIPSLGINAPLVAENLTPDGSLVIPGDPDVVGRWAGGPDLRATVGTTLLAGHVSVREDDGALHELYRIAAGALVVATDAAGRSFSWRVAELSVRNKDDLPTFPVTGARRLAIVTCGGPLLSTDHGRSFRDNVIVWAQPIG